MVENKLNSKISTKIAVLYIVVMGIGMSIMHYVFGHSYSDPEMVYVIGWVEIILSLIAIVTVLKFSNWREIGFGKMRVRHLVWLIPGILNALFILFAVFQKISMGGFSFSQWKLFTVIGITMLLVGFSEELMFRGIVLRGALASKSIFTSVLISALFFSTLHSVNVLGGADIISVIIQMVITFIFGLFAGLVSLKLRNITPLIIAHFLWDFSLFASPMVAVGSFMSFALPLFEIVFIIILWISMRKETPESVKILLTK